MQPIITFIAQYFLLLSFAGAIFVWFNLKAADRKQFLLIGILGAVLALLLAKIGGMFYFDTRPFIAGNFSPYFDHTNSNGFPSDHTLLSSFLGFLVLRYHKAWGVALLILALIIGLSRVVAGVHHLQDIVGSFVFAGIAVWFVGMMITQRHKPTHSQEKDQQDN
jgi:undecaprenyl-diphosphatase